MRLRWWRRGRDGREPHPAPYDLVDTDFGAWAPVPEHDRVRDGAAPPETPATPHSKMA